MEFAKQSHSMCYAWCRQLTVNNASFGIQHNTIQAVCGNVLHFHLRSSALGFQAPEAVNADGSTLQQYVLHAAAVEHTISSMLRKQLAQSTQ